jgi:hypothetical protein
MGLKRACSERVLPSVHFFTLLSHKFQILAKPMPFCLLLLLVATSIQHRQWSNAMAGGDNGELQEVTMVSTASCAVVPSLVLCYCCSVMHGDRWNHTK